MLFWAAFWMRRGNLAMVAALRSTDLSIFGPLNAFRPILALLFGWVFLGEKPTGIGAVGVVIIMSRTVLLFSKNEAVRFGVRLRTFSLRLLGLSLSTIGAVFLKRAALEGCAELTLCAWIVCSLLCLLVVALSQGDQAVRMVATGIRENGFWLLLHST